MAMDYSGLFTNPADIRNARIDDLMKQRQAIQGMGGSMAGLLGQVAAGGGATGSMMAEALGGMFGMKTAEEAKAEQEQAIAKGLDIGNVDSLSNAISKLKETGNTAGVLKLTEVKNALVEKNLKKDQEAKARESVAAYLESKGSKALAESVRNGLDLDKAMAAVKPMEVGGALVNPDTKEVLIPAVKKPDTTYTLLSKEEVAKLAETNPNIDTSLAWQRDSTGKLHALSESDTISKYGTIPSGMELVESVDANGVTTAYLRPMPGSDQANKLIAANNAKRNAAQNTAIKANTVSSAISGALKIIKNNPNATGTTGALIEDISGFPLVGAFTAGSGRKDLQGYVDTVRANVGFNELKAMKESSSTGASGLGQLAIQEMLALQRTLGDLDLNQSPEKVEESLNNIQQSFDMAATKMANEFTDEELAKYGLDYLSMYRTGESGSSKMDIIRSDTAPANSGLTDAEWSVMSPEDRALFAE